MCVRSKGTERERERVPERLREPGTLHLMRFMRSRSAHTGDGSMITSYVTPITRNHVTLRVMLRVQPRLRVTQQLCSRSSVLCERHDVRGPSPRRMGKGARVVSPMNDDEMINDVIHRSPV